MMNRLHNLDYLRGISAFGIMIYHYLSWTGGHFSSESFMARVGLYGVSIFYVLSGLTLYHVYNQKMLPSKADIYDFVKKRCFRIFPLLWLATIISIILKWDTPDMMKVFLNLTGLFGFISWDAYFATGAWSIGNELVFYVFFPFFILFSKKSKGFFVLFTAVIFIIYLYFAFGLLNINVGLVAQWRDYVNPLNQVFLFLGGFLIGLIFKKIELKNSLCLLLILGGFGVFIFFPVSGDTVYLVTGINRLVFTFSCFSICLAFYKFTFQFPTFAHRPLSKLGEASYSVYLLHPIVYFVISGFSEKIFMVSVNVKLCLSICGTLIMSYFVYEYFEKFFMRLGRGRKALSN